MFDLELGFEVRSASAAIGGCGDREGRSWCDICEAEREDGKEEREARGLAAVGGPLVNDWEVAVRVRKGKDPWIEVMFEPVVLESVEAGLQVDGGRAQGRRKGGAGGRLAAPSMDGLLTKEDAALSTGLMGRVPDLSTRAGRRDSLSLRSGAVRVTVKVPL